MATTPSCGEDPKAKVDRQPLRFEDNGETLRARNLRLSMSG